MERAVLLKIWSYLIECLYRNFIPQLSATTKAQKDVFGAKTVRLDTKHLHWTTFDDFQSCGNRPIRTRRINKNKLIAI